MGAKDHLELASPSQVADVIVRLVAERGATMPRGDLLASAAASRRRPAEGPPSIEVLDELREERL